MSSFDGRTDENKLLAAVVSGKSSAVDLLLSQGVDPDARVDGARIPKRTFERIQTRARRGSFWSARNGKTALALACARGDVNIAALLLEAGARVELRFPFAGTTTGTALYLTAVIAEQLESPVELTKLLLRHGATVNVHDDGSKRETPLTWAAKVGHTELLDLLIAHGADVRAPGERALYRAVEYGHFAAANILLCAGAFVDCANGQGRSAAQRAIVNNDLDILELLLQFGASPTAALAKGALADEAGFERLVLVLARDPRFIATLADYSGLAADGSSTVVATLRDDSSIVTTAISGHSALAVDHTKILRGIGFDTWCDGGASATHLHEEYGIRGTELLGAEILGHTIQLRVRPSHLAAAAAPPPYAPATAVVLQGLTRNSAKNGQRGTVLGMLADGRCSVKLHKSTLSIKPENLRPTKDLGRSAFAGHAVDAVNSFLLSGCTGDVADMNGPYVETTRTRGAQLWPDHCGFPIFTGATGRNWGYAFMRMSDGYWVATEANGTPPECREFGALLATRRQTCSLLHAQWRVTNSDGTALVDDDAVNVATWPSTAPDAPYRSLTQAWKGGAPLQPWVLRDGVVEAFCAASREHKVVLTDAERTAVWVRLDHFRFLDWNLLPHCRAAIHRPRTVLTALMVLNRLARNEIASEPALTADWIAPPGTPLLRVCLRSALAVPLRRGANLGDIFRESVWPHVLGAPDLRVQGRAERGARVSGRDVTGRGGGGRVSRAGGGAERGQQAKKKGKKGKKGRRRRT